MKNEGSFYCTYLPRTTYREINRHCLEKRVGFMVSYLNLVVYVALSLATGFFTTSLHLSSWFLQGLHSYLYPENPVGNEHQDAQGGTGSRSTNEKEGESCLSGLDTRESSSMDRERDSRVGKEKDGEVPLDEIRKDCCSLEGIEHRKEGEDHGQPEVGKEQTGHPSLSKKESNDSSIPSNLPTKDKPRAILKSLRKRKEKVKDRFEWEEGSSQILRLTVGHSHLHGRHYYQEYDEAIIYSVVGITNLLAREFLSYANSKGAVNASQKVGFFRSDDLIPFLMSLFSAYKIARLLARVGWERSTSRISELTLSCSVGFIGFLIALSLLTFVPANLVDFGFEKVYLNANRISGVDPKQQTAFLSLPPFLVKIIIAAVAGWVSGIFVGPAHRSVRSFWLGSDQLQWNIPVIKLGLIAHFLLHLNVIFPLLSSILWIKPLGELFIVCKSSGQPFATHQRPEMSIYGGTFTQWQDVPSIAMKPGLNTLKKESFQMQDYCQENKFVRQVESSQENCIISEHRQIVEEGNIQGPILRNPTNADECVQLGACCADEHKEEHVDEHKEERTPFWGTPSFPAPSDRWAQDFCMSENTFEEVCFWSLVVGGLLQVFLFRVNVQTYLNEAVLVWYESLHRSKVMNLELTRAKLILNNYFLCRAAIQFLVPGMLAVLFLGMSRVQGNPSITSTTETLFSGSLFIKVLTLFMAWWITFSRAIITCIILALYRLGFLLAT